MSTTATPPPAAPATSAPSTPASSTPSTPISTPSTPPVETSTPVAPATPESAAVATPETPAAAETPATPTKPQPKVEDFPGDIQGYLNALHQWETENPGTEIADQAIEEPKVETPKVEEEKKEETDVDKPWAPEQEAVTPEVVSGWAEKNPLLKQVWEQNPEIKNQMHAMARQLAFAKPIADLFPDVESAERANTVAGRFVDIQSLFTDAADDPTKIDDAYNALSSQFQVLDDKGNPVLDSEGNPTYTPDFHAMNDLVVSTWQENKLEEYQAAVATGGDEDAEYALQAIKFLQEYETKKKDPGGPDVSKLPPELKAWHDQEAAKLAAEREKLGLQTKQQTADQKKQTAELFHGNVMKKTGSAAGKFIDEYLAEKEANGIYIPSYALEAKEPGKNLSSFAERIIKQYVAKCNSVAKIKEDLAKLRRLPPSQENEEQRVKYNTKLIHQFLPGIVDSEVRQIQTKVKADSDKRSKALAKRAEVSNVEPQGGTAPQPQVMNEADTYKTARANVLKRDPDLEGAELQYETFKERNRLTAR